MSEFKTKIDLSIYNFKSDIQHRLLLSTFSREEIYVLREILDDSLTISIKQLIQNTGICSKSLQSLLSKLNGIPLIQQKKDTLHINRELRKYYQVQIRKFDEEFEPCLDFLQKLLLKVPFHELFNWYSISDEAESIFPEILNNYLKTPKKYEQYLSQLKFEDSTLQNIVEDVFSAPNLEVTASSLIKKYKLSKEKFEEYILYLEFHLVCSVKHQLTNKGWEATVTPLKEWKQYLQASKEAVPSPIKSTTSIQRDHADDFGFVRDLSLLIEQLHDGMALPIPNTEYSHKLIDTALGMHLVHTEDLLDKKSYRLTPEGIEWQQKTLRRRALAVYRYTISQLYRKYSPTYAERDLGEIERSLRRIASLGWIYLENFLAGVMVPVGKSGSVSLEKKGTKWEYTFPKYSDDDLKLMRAVIEESLFEAGIVATGTHNQRRCFCITPYGRDILGE